MGFLPDWIPNPASAYTDLYEGLAGNLWGGISGQSQADANKANQASANSAQAFSQASADKQMAFQERMSNTAYQRQKLDMEQAGYNPLMAYLKGGGASIPSGASASGVSAHNEDVGGAAVKNTSNLIGSATSLGTLPSTLSQMNAQTQATSAQAAQTEALTPALVAKAQSETLNNSAQAMEASERTKTYTPGREKMLQEIKNLVESGKINKLDAETKKRLLDWQKANPKIYRTKNTLDHINPLKGMFNN